jgi:hypothetical protein
LFYQFGRIVSAPRPAAINDGPELDTTHPAWRVMPEAIHFPKSDGLPPWLVLNPTMETSHVTD